jgi:hypothetical protein
MTIASYADLVSEIGNWLNRDITPLPVGSFIRLFEARMNRKLRTPDQQITASVTLLTNVNTYAIPSSIRQVKQVFTGDTNGVTVTLNPMTRLRLQQDYPVPLVGIPQAYAIEGTQIILAPSPDGISNSNTLTITGYNTLPPLDGVTNLSNWLLAAHPDAYLYGALTEAAAYLRDDEHLGLWRAALDDVIEDILKESTQRKIPMGPLRTMPAIWE